MKKLLIFTLTAALLLSLMACGGPVNDPQTQNGLPDDPPVSATTQDPDPEDTQPDIQDEQEPDGEAQDPAQDETQDPADETQEDGQEDGSETNDPPAEADPAPQPSDDEPDDEPEPDSNETQTGSEVSSLPPQQESDPEPETGSTASPAEQKAIAEGLIGRPVSELYAAIGEPLAADYSPSCLDLDSDDGELTYDGFVVYTEGAPNNETVYAVI